LRQAAGRSGGHRPSSSTAQDGPALALIRFDPEELDAAMRELI
jgi:hypothetical protein